MTSIPPIAQSRAKPRKPDTSPPIHPENRVPFVLLASSVPAAARDVRRVLKSEAVPFREIGSCDEVQPFDAVATLIVDRSVDLPLQASLQRLHRAGWGIVFGPSAVEKHVSQVFSFALHVAPGSAPVIVAAGEFATLPHYLWLAHGRRSFSDLQRASSRPIGDDAPQASLEDRDTLRDFPGLRSATIFLRDVKTGRLDAENIRDLFKLNRTEMAKHLNVSPQAVLQNPVSESYQLKLRLFEQVARILVAVPQEEFARWLHSAIADFATTNEPQGATPAELVKRGDVSKLADYVADFLENRTS